MKNEFSFITFLSVGWMVVCVCVPSRVSHRCHFDWIPEPCVKLPWLTTTLISLTNVLSGIVGHSSDGRTLSSSLTVTLSAHDEFPQTIFFLYRSVFIRCIFRCIRNLFMGFVLCLFFNSNNNNEKMFLHIITFIFHLFYEFLFL